MTSSRRVGGCLTIITAVVILLFLLMVLAESGVFPIVGALLAGWYPFLQRTVSSIHVDRVALWSAAVSLLIVTVGVHWFCSWIYRVSVADASPRRWPWRWSLSFIVLLLLMFAAGIAIVALAHQFLWIARSPRPLYARDSYAHTAQCANRMHQLAFAIVDYAKAHDGRYPDTLADAMASGQLRPEALICPLSGDLPARGRTTREIQAELAVPGHNSYSYIGAGLTTATATEARPMIYESSLNHFRDIAAQAGMNIAFADGHVSFHRRSEADEILAPFRSTTQPAGIAP